MSTRISRWLGVGIAALAVAAFSTTASAQQAPDQQVGSVRVVHGLRGLVADIYLDGNLALPTFQPERATDPLSIPAGQHLVEIRSAGAAKTDTPLLAQNVTVPAGFEGSLIAHLGADGKPTLTAYADDLTPVPAGQTRVIVRHAAAADGVSVLFNDLPAIPSLAPDAEGIDIVAAGDYKVAVTPLAGGAPLATPQDVQLAEGTANFMYLIGSQADGTLGWAAVQVKDLQTAPAVIQTGDGSTRRTGSAPAPIALAAIVASVLAAAAGAASVARARRAAR